MPFSMSFVKGAICSYDQYFFLIIYIELLEQRFPELLASQSFSGYCLISSLALRFQRIYSGHWSE